MPISATKESRGSHLIQSNSRIQFLPRNSIIHFQSQSYTQCLVLQSHTTCSLSEQFSAHCSKAHPNVHLIPFRNANDQKKSIPNLPFSTTQFLEQSNHPLLCSHIISKFLGHPLLCYTIPQATPPFERFPHLGSQKAKEYPYLKTIIPDIA